MYESALRKDLVDDIEMREWVELHAGWHGAPALRAVMRRRRPGERPTGSDVETICLQVYRRAGIPAVRQYQVVDAYGEHVAFGDFGFPPKACITEVDGLQGHDLERRQHDYDRQGRVEDQGFLVRRFTAEDVKYRGWYVCERTLRAIAMARPL
jgi:very-short-patch-repair endonuclease